MANSYSVSASRIVANQSATQIEESKKVVVCEGAINAQGVLGLLAVVGFVGDAFLLI